MKGVYKVRIWLPVVVDAEHSPTILEYIITVAAASESDAEEEGRRIFFRYVTGLSETQKLELQVRTFALPREGDFKINER